MLGWRSDRFMAIETRIVYDVVDGSEGNGFARQPI
jgi:hypothetical protein